MTENEAEMLREVEKVAHETAAAFIDPEAPPEFTATLIGTLLASVDGVFAIRDGKPWRGLTDPREIAGKLLREAGLGE